MAFLLIHELVRKRLRQQSASGRNKEGIALFYFDN